MKKTLWIILAVVLLFLIGCSKKEAGQDQSSTDNNAAEVQIIKNTSDPASPDLNIVPKLLFTVNSIDKTGKEVFRRLQQLSSAADGTFFVADPGTFSIRKFSSSGEFISSFGKQGNGPGEFMMMNTGLCILKDRIIIPDPMTMGVKIFDLEGNFIETINTAQKGIGMIITPESFSDAEFLSLNSTVAQEGEKLSMKTKLSVFTEGINVKSTIWEYEQLFDPSDVSKIMAMGKDYPAYTAGNGKVYLSQSGTEKYEITVYDGAGKELYRFKMPYRKIRYTEEEKTKINEAMKNYVDPAAKQFMKDFKFDEEFKKVINSMYLDGSGRLWVEKSFESTGEKDLRKIDIFKDGIYQNTFDLKDDSGNNIKGILKIAKDRLYAVDFENNVINVYSI